MTNILNKPIKPCSLNPVTGYNRDGYCTNNYEDSGTHVVCSQMTDKFLKFTKEKGNNLITPNSNFSGLKTGDKWCLCARRWEEAHKADVAPLVDVYATDKSALNFNSLNIYLKHKIARTSHTIKNGENSSNNPKSSFNVDIDKNHKPIIVITGSCANSGKSYLAKHLASELEKEKEKEKEKTDSKVTILSSDKIRIPLHSGNKPNHTLWNSLTKEKQKDLGHTFDTIGGEIINEKTNKPYTKKQIDKYGGLWNLSSILTSKYIINYIKKHHKTETIIVEGQFQLSKNFNIDLITNLSQFGAYFFYMNTELKVCKERHNMNNKNYNKELIGKYLSDNKPLEQWLSNSNWKSKLSNKQKQILDSTTQHILDGNNNVKDNIENVKKIIKNENKNNNNNKNNKNNKNNNNNNNNNYIYKTQKHINKTFKVFTYKPTKKNGVQSVIKSLKSLDETRQETESRMTKNIQAPSDITNTENSFTLDDIDITKYKNNKLLQTKYIMKNCNKYLDDLGALMSGSFEPPSYIKINTVQNPIDIYNMSQNSKQINCYDVPILLIKNGKINISIPNNFKPFTENLMKMIEFYLKYINNLEGIIMLASLQIMVAKPGQSTSLEGTHLDNVKATYYNKDNNTTTQVPTALYTLEYIKDKKGIWKLSNENTMSTVLYSVKVNSNDIKEEMINEATMIDVSKYFVPFEILAIFLKYQKLYEDKVIIEKNSAHNGVISLFNHPHKAISNKSDKEILRVQMRFMICNIQTVDKNGVTLYGYDKQGTNNGLDDLLRKNYKNIELNGWEKNGCSRYKHFNFDVGRCELYENPQTFEQKYGFPKAVDKGDIKTHYHGVFKLVYGTEFNKK